MIKYTLREANLERQKEWDPENQISLSYRGNELAGEIGEACNVIKKLDRERMGIRGSRTTKKALAEELADGIICIDLIASLMDIDLMEAVQHKFNKTSEDNGLETKLADISINDYEEGKRAFWNSYPIDNNPYIKQRGIEWRHGWLAAQCIEKAIESHHEVG